MCGKVTDREMLANYYARADLFLFPSLYDASSIVQIESASQKTPTLFLEGAVTNATVTKDVNGFIVENDAEKYANKIVEIIKNKELYNMVSENAYKDLYVNWDDRVKEAYDMYIEKIGE
jgi:glycosyltransferase involved in cell wall biosynthesis